MTVRVTSPWEAHKQKRPRSLPSRVPYQAGSPLFGPGLRGSWLGPRGLGRAGWAGNATGHTHSVQESEAQAAFVELPASSFGTGGLVSRARITPMRASAA